MNRAAGVVTSRKVGSVSAMMLPNTRSVCPWLVSKSNRRSACVSQTINVSVLTTATKAPAAAQALKPVGGLVAKAAKSEGFKGKKAKTLELVAPAGLDVDRLLVVGLGKPKELAHFDWLKLGGTAMGRVSHSGKA